MLEVANGSPKETNWLLSSLPDVEYRVLQSLCETVELPRDHVLFEPGQAIRFASFPQTGSLSCVTRLADGTYIETATVGFEGMTGMSLVNEVARVPGKCFVQIAATVKQVPRESFAEALRLYPALSILMRRYSQALSDQLSQRVACNARHSILQRCAKWLLLTHDQMVDDFVPLTQQFLATMLGVRRASVSEAAEALQRKNVIAYSRGRIKVTDRRGLELLACGCYGATNNAYQNSLPETHQAFFGQQMSARARAVADAT